MPKPRLTRCLALLGLVTLLPSQVSAQAPTKATFQAIYDKEAALYAKMDFEAIYANAAPDFVDIDKDGKKHTLAETKAQIAQLKPLIKSFRYKGTIVSVTAKAAATVVNVKEKVTIIMANPQTHQSVRVVVDNVSDDSWKKVGGHWLRSGSKTLSQTEKQTPLGPAGRSKPASRLRRVGERNASR